MLPVTLCKKVQNSDPTLNLTDWQYTTRSESSRAMACSLLPFFDLELAYVKD